MPMLVHFPPTGMPGFDPAPAPAPEPSAILIVHRSSNFPAPAPAHAGFFAPMVGNVASEDVAVMDDIGLSAGCVKESRRPWPCVPYAARVGCIPMPTPTPTPTPMPTPMPMPVPMSLGVLGVAGEVYSGCRAAYAGVLVAATDAGAEASMSMRLGLPLGSTGAAAVADGGAA
ncbi:hypothetical protein HETIRDRAFT_305884 [Heterobasidion irregulare TC 32-1]|uniref:Uncharacterized protein n=1 Tax=Heterobasidion irregulare (strain TC 32-1) TaxID=747525 RepID=W4KKV3_HETIT|nr:uncharacterized protein HETIRDRAFT_305884 [Heterobasidion irregulare TC 32-1]ETW86483.1 hypothetical protein HETIRDRAFT_305884 [Heterobasidion irregulare TC 32-1]